MSKLGIKPFTIGFVPLVALDTKEKKVYSEIRIDRDGAVNEMKSAFAKALPLQLQLVMLLRKQLSF